jgi:feruloyl esterase
MRLILAFTLVLAATFAAGVAIAQASPQPSTTAAQSCEGLLRLALPNTSITSAQVVGPGAFTASAASSGPNAFAALPAFCRVAATLRPSSDSEIKIEVWLPIAGWNGKFLAMGSGGWGGAIDYQGLRRS